jgi:hypothetical protein
MTWHTASLRLGTWLLMLGCVPSATAQVRSIYSEPKLTAEQARLQGRVKELWQKMYNGLLMQDEKIALQRARLQFPIHSDNDLFPNFRSHSRDAIVVLPIHALLLIEDLCTAYAWLHEKAFSTITINEYAAMLKYRQPKDFPRAVYPPPLEALGIPNDALSDPRVEGLSLRFRNSAYAYVLAHEMGHVLYRHPGNNSVPAETSRKNERQADDFATMVLQRDRQIPMGAVLYFQMTGFIASYGRYDYPTEDKWQEALRNASHPVTADRIKALAQGIRQNAGLGQTNREIALDVADKLDRIGDEMNDPDWHRYFRLIGERADVARLRPRKE